MAKERIVILYDPESGEVELDTTIEVSITLLGVIEVVRALVFDKIPKTRLVVPQARENRRA